jgi:glutamate formiminotransferase / 5-formyltetrahydrofolate cyclo-ligase
MPGAGRVGHHGRVQPLLMAVPNVSEGSDPRVLARVREAFAPARCLDVHADPDHGRSVFTLAAPQGQLAAGLVAGARAVTEAVDLRERAGLHPHVGALDVMPVVYLDPERRGAACAEVLTAAGLIGDELGVPVFLYGELATDPGHAERADLRRGGPAALAARMERGELRPDFGPARVHPTAGALLAAARPPLVAFNVDLASADVELAKAVAADIRESGPAGLAGVRAIGLMLDDRGRAQVSTNVHDHLATPLAAVVEAVRARAPVAEAELVGLAPRAAFDGFPEDVPLRGFDPERHLIENALRSAF